MIAAEVSTQSRNGSRHLMASEPLKQNRRSFALMPTLVASIGTLALLSVGSILTINWIVGRQIVQELTDRLISRTLATEEMALRHHLDAAIDQANFIAAAIRDGRYQFSEPLARRFRQRHDRGGTPGRWPHRQRHRWSCATCPSRRIWNRFSIGSVGYRRRSSTRGARRQEFVSAELRLLGAADFSRADAVDLSELQCSDLERERLSGIPRGRNLDARLVVIHDGLE